MSGERQGEQNAPSAVVVADAATLLRLMPIEFGSVRTHRLFSAEDVAVSGMAMDTDTVMREHVATVPFLVQLVEGRAIAHLDDERIEMSAGTMLHVPPDVPLSIEALDPSRVLMAAMLLRRSHPSPNATETDRAVNSS